MVHSFAAELSHMLIGMLAVCAARSTLPRAARKYKQLNALALGVVRSGGIFMTCSCSGAMTQSGGLPKVVQEAAAEAERQVGEACVMLARLMKLLSSGLAGGAL